MERIEEKLLRCCSLRCERVVNRKPVPIPQVLFLLFYFLALLQFGENYNLKLHNCIVQSNFTQGVRIIPYNSYYHEKQTYTMSFYSKVQPPQVLSSTKTFSSNGQLIKSRLIYSHLSYHKLGAYQ